MSPKQPLVQSTLVPLGALINATTVILGSLVGIALKDYIGASYQDILFQAIGLGVLLLGIKMGLQTPNNGWAAVILGLLIGTVIGTFLNIEGHMQRMASSIEQLFHFSDPDFNRGLVSAFIIFCVGAMTILGSLEEGLSGNRSLILTKSILDGFTSIVLAGAYGPGVLFSAIPLFILQSSISYGARTLRPILSDEDLNMISGIGGVLIIGISIEMIGLKDIHLENMLPALFLVPIIARLFLKLKIIRS